MDVRTVRRGLLWMSGCILSISLLSFLGEDVFQFLHLTEKGRSLLFFWGFLGVGTIGCFSTIIIIHGFLRPALPGRRARLMPVLVFFLLAVMLFVWMLYCSFHEVTSPRLHPGETITI